MYLTYPVKYLLIDSWHYKLHSVKSRIPEYGKRGMEFLETGKLKPDFLEALLGKIEITDKRVVVGPGIGDDAAVLDFGENYLIVKSDPITFVSGRIGWYVVNVNANDIAAMGGTPRWFLVTILLPEKHTTISLLEEIMGDLRRSCGELGIALIGGHTEVTHGLENPILSGTMLGEASREQLIKNDRIHEGDVLYMTKGVAVEATSIIAREKKDEVIERFGEEFYRRCLAYLEQPGISVVQEAKKACDAVEVSGMHDPTEGGILSGAYEMVRASMMDLELELDRVPVYEETRTLCEYFHLSPYGCIASGSLLIAVPHSECEGIERAFSTGVQVFPSLTRVGQFTKSGGSMYVTQEGVRKALRPSGKDELTHIL
jgi:hydrogenase expression/formation protein HypE